ncbi:hypothetical protein J18TS1_12470 [Oceanobacillus oncorhynchi subsp. incaldanensis]|uniref:hypothetical protein n=1 Tax=Oceanobacillus oncorhynchi TaxID=545501 RepID=UPI001B2DB8F3|nr:hypothetical protein [Oceanobacillus oncorhynchi]GIO18147.1 hypothetical protein J18TS1_12470 [Oceanobacillus oncorhynchi subsp. incaldanensis]
MDKQERYLKSVAASLERLVKLKEKEVKLLTNREHHKFVEIDPEALTALDKSLRDRNLRR